MPYRRAPAVTAAAKAGVKLIDYEKLMAPPWRVPARSEADSSRATSNDASGPLLRALGDLGVELSSPIKDSALLTILGEGVK